MHNTVNISDKLFYVGASDRRIELFENLYPVPDGMSYNSYLLKDKKTVLFDSCDASVQVRFFENVAYALGSDPLDYFVVSHVEPDHAATAMRVLELHPETKLVCTAKALGLLGQFFGADLSERTTVVGEGDVLDLGGRVLRFITAPMVHWPEVMVTYDETDGYLFSADAFGTFGSLGGNVFYDETVGFDTSEYRRYYSNIVGKYGMQVTNLLKKASALDIRAILPLHGPIIRTAENVSYIIGKYSLWAAYAPETDGVMIAYNSVYGATANAAEILACRLAEEGIKGVRVFDVSKTHPSYLVSEAFRVSKIVIAATTYNNSLFPTMETFLTELGVIGLKGRDVYIIENGSWVPQSGKLVREKLCALKGLNVSDATVSFRSSVNETARAALTELTQKIAEKA